MIRKLLLGSVAAGGLVAALPASAADLGVRPAPAPAYVAPVAAPVFSWTGFYIGGHAGGAWGDYQYTTVWAPDQDVFSSGDTGGTFIGGGQIGFNWQTGIWVWGVEADISGKSLRASNDVSLLLSTPFNSLDAKTDLQGSVRGRLGFTFGQFLLYGTGGWAAADTKVTGCGGVTTGCFEDSQTLNGWTAGVGVEFAFTNNVSLGVEYRYSDLGDEQFNFGSFLGQPAFADVGLQEHQVTARLNFKFGSLFGLP